MSRKQALETGADIRVERPHSVNGDGYKDPENGEERRGFCDHQEFGAGDPTGWLGNPERT